MYIHRMPIFRRIARLIKSAIVQWYADDAPQLGAALAFYTMLSLGPVLLIAVSLAGLVFGQEAASGHLVAQLEDIIGRSGAETIQAVIVHSNVVGSGVRGTTIGIIMLLVGAYSAFGQLQYALNVIWKVEHKKKGIFHTIKNRSMVFVMVLVIGGLLFLSLLASALLEAFTKYVVEIGPHAPLLQLLNTAVSLSIGTLLFAMIFKILPEKRVAWSEVWFAALVTGLLFALGKYAIGLYLGRSALSTAYGAAGTLVALLLWIYYSAQILFFGAELAKEYSKFKEKPPV